MTDTTKVCAVCGTGHIRVSDSRPVVVAGIQTVRRRLRCEDPACGAAYFTVEFPEAFIESLIEAQKLNDPFIREVTERVAEHAGRMVGLLQSVQRIMGERAKVSYLGPLVRSEEILTIKHDPKHIKRVTRAQRDWGDDPDTLVQTNGGRHAAR